MITIHQSYISFTTIPGTPCLLPGTDTYVVAYPTKLEIFSLSHALRYVSQFHGIEGLVEKFKVVVDLERGGVTVEGHAPNGFYRILIAPGKLQVKKGHVRLEGDQFTCVQYPRERERLSFGVHKAIFWPKVVERRSLDELLPLFYAVTHGYPAGEEQNTQLANIRDERDLIALFTTGFQGMFVPQQVDSNYHGHLLQPSTLPSPEILGTLHRHLRAMFVIERESTLHLLPQLPSKLVAGRFINVLLQKGHKISFEWTKGKLRQVIVDAAIDDQILLTAQDLKRCRIRQKKSQAGKIVALHSPLQLQAGIRYLLDTFAK